MICTNCGGTGLIPVEISPGIEEDQTCEVCEGSGEIEEKE